MLDFSDTIDDLCGPPDKALRLARYFGTSAEITVQPAAFLYLTDSCCREWKKDQTFYLCAE